MKKFLSVIVVVVLAGCGSAPAPKSGGASNDSENSKSSSSSGTITVSQSGGGDCKSINEAIKKAKPGETIKIRPGTYKEAVEVEKTLTLIGDGKTEEIIIENSGNSPLGTKAKDVRVSKMTFKHTGNSGKVTVNAAGGDLIIEDCDISANAGNGLQIIKGASVEVRRSRIHDCKGDKYPAVVNFSKLLMENCEIDSNAGDAIWLKNSARSLIKNTKIHDNGCNGVNLEDAVDCTLEGNEIYNQKFSGVLVQKAKSNAQIKGCKIHDNDYSGIHLSDVVGAVIENCEVYNNCAANQDCAISIATSKDIVVRGCKTYGNHSAGIIAHRASKALIDNCDVYENNGTAIGSRMAGSDTIVRKCRIYKNVNNGACALETAKLTLEDNDIYGNGYPGACAADGSEIVMLRNKIHDHQNRGILLNTKSKGTGEDNDVFNNAWSGIEVQTGSKLTLKKSRVTKNGEAAVYVFSGGACNFEENDLRGNGKGSWSVLPDSKANVTRKGNQEDETLLSKAKVGDWIERKVIFTAAGRTREQSVRIAVTAKTADDITVELTSNVDGQENKKTEKAMLYERQDFMNEIEKDADEVIAEPEKGLEPLTIGGRTITAIWKKYTVLYTKNEQRFTGRFKVWTSPQVPLDNTVKVEGDLPGNVKLIAELVNFGDAQTLKTATSKPSTETKAPAKTQASAPPPPPAVQAPAPKKAEPQAAPPAAKGTGATVYVLNDGKRIRAEKTVDAGDELSIKDENGKFHLIKKSDIKETVNE